MGYANLIDHSQRMKYTSEQQRSYFARSKELLKMQVEQVADDQASDLLSELILLLNYNEWKYYVQNDPVISDFEYDHLFKLLEALEAKYPESISSNSPTQRVSNDLTEDFPSVPHLTPMLSLANSYNADDLLEFDKQIHKLVNLPEGTPVEYVVEPKFDGGSIALVYEGDQLVRGATRGNGRCGRLSPRGPDDVVVGWAVCFWRRYAVQEYR